MEALQKYTHLNYRSAHFFIIMSIMNEDLWNVHCDHDADDLSLNLLGDPSFDDPSSSSISVSPIKVSFSSPDNQNTTASSALPLPFRVIRNSARAFAGIKYKLSCLHGINMNTSVTSKPPILTKAIMRVEAAICAFGGTLHERRLQCSESIFRLKNLERSDRRRYYEHVLHERYDTSDGQLEWRFEESPPVSNERRGRPAESNEREGPPAVSTEKPHKTQQPRPSSQSKIKYKCKLCGQPKNNHVCPYRQPLQRSIGVMVYPAINSFTAPEPGSIAPPLSKMNNFVSYDSEGDVTPEHYRSITRSHSQTNPHSDQGLYQYPPIPLTFQERKNLSDTLFVLSKEIPGMTQECALVLRKARANQEWDVAVAELMAQVVVGIYCRENDACLDGLRQYLFTLGISC